MVASLYSAINILMIFIVTMFNELCLKILFNFLNPLIGLSSFEL